MLQTKYITLEEFLEYSGIDLHKQLVEDDNPSNTAMAFLVRLENRMSAFIDGNFNVNVDAQWGCMSDYQKGCYKRALMEQAMYIFRNGDISVDSGLDLDKGEVISDKTLKAKSIAPNAKDELVRCGIWNRQVRSTRVGYGWSWWLR